MEQVRDCASSRYETVDPTNIVVRSKSADRVAAALADAFLKDDGPVCEIAVMAWPSTTPGNAGPMLIRFDSGYVSELQPGIVHFDLRTAWDGLLETGNVCEKQLEFTVKRD